jgi:hypothetical protein
MTKYTVLPDMVLNKPVNKYNSEFEKTLGEILNSPKDLEEKKQEYIEILQSLLTQKDKNQIASQSDSGFQMLYASFKDKIIAKKAENLKNYLNNITDISWDKRGLVYINNNELKGVHIFDLIADAVTSNNKIRSSSKAWKNFKQFLRTSNVPKSFLGSNSISQEILPKPTPYLGAPLTTTNKKNKKAKKAKKAKPLINKVLPPIRVSSRTTRGVAPKRLIGNGIKKRWLRF